MTTKLEKLTEETVRFQEYIKQKGKELLLGATQEIFSNYPQVKKIYWVQYTPYFNDGEACYFRVGNLHALIIDPEKVAEYEAEKQDHDAKQATAKELTEEQRNNLGIKIESWEDINQEKLCDEICVYNSSYNNQYIITYGELWKDLLEIAMWIGNETNQATLESVFGDHAKITITREGVKISEYDHE